MPLFAGTSGTGYMSAAKPTATKTATTSAAKFAGTSGTGYTSAAKPSISKPSAPTTSTAKFAGTGGSGYASAAKSTAPKSSSLSGTGGGGGGVSGGFGITAYGRGSSGGNPMVGRTVSGPGKTSFQGFGSGTSGPWGGLSVAGGKSGMPQGMTAFGPGGRANASYSPGMSLFSGLNSMTGRAQRNPSQIVAGDPMKVPGQTRLTIDPMGSIDAMAPRPGVPFTGVDYGSNFLGNAALPKMQVAKFQDRLQESPNPPNRPSTGVTTRSAQITTPATPVSTAAYQNPARAYPDRGLANALQNVTNPTAQAAIERNMTRDPWNYINPTSNLAAKTSLPQPTQTASGSFVNPVSTAEMKSSLLGPVQGPQRPTAAPYYTMAQTGQPAPQPRMSVAGGFGMVPFGRRGSTGGMNVSDIAMNSGGITGFEQPASPQMAGTQVPPDNSLYGDAPQKPTVGGYLQSKIETPAQKMAAILGGVDRGMGKLGFSPLNTPMGQGQGNSSGVSYGRGGKTPALTPEQTTQINALPPAQQQEIRLYMKRGMSFADALARIGQKPGVTPPWFNWRQWAVGPRPATA